MKNIVLTTLVIAIFVSSSWALVNPKLFPVHDSLHAARISQMNLALSEGHFPVRWSPDYGYGYGMPLFQFYAPLPYYSGNIFYSLGLSTSESIRLLYVITNIVTLIGAYKLGKILFGSSGGLIAAAAITLAPYRAVNLFVRGAISEAWGIMALPWILYGIICVLEKKPRGWVVLTISLLVLFLSHNITTLLFIPVSVVFALGYWLAIKGWPKSFNLSAFRPLLSLGTCYVLAGMMASFYLIPALLEKDYTRVQEAIIGGYFDYRLHFLYIRQFFQVNWGYGGSVFGPDDEMSFYLGTGQLVGMGIVGLLLLWQVMRLFFFNYSRIRFPVAGLLKSPSLSQLTILFTSGGVLVLALYMSIFKSQFVWEKIVFLEFVQFPWRWLAVVIIFLALFIATIPVFIANKKFRFKFSVVVVLVLILTSWQFFQPKSNLDNDQALYYTDRMLIREQGSGLLPDYIPAQMSGVEDLPVPKLDEVLFCQIENNCDFDYEVLVNRGHEALVRVDTDQVQMIEFTRADFPGWIVELDGEVTDNVITDRGLVAVRPESGEQIIGIRFSNSPVRSIADTISVLGLFSFTTLAFLSRKKQAFS